MELKRKLTSRPTQICLISGTGEKLFEYLQGKKQFWLKSSHFKMLTQYRLQLKFTKYELNLKCKFKTMKLLKETDYIQILRLSKYFLDLKTNSQSPLQKI